MKVSGDGHLCVNLVMFLRYSLSNNGMLWVGVIQDHWKMAPFEKSMII